MKFFYSILFYLLPVITIAQEIDIQVVTDSVSENKPVIQTYPYGGATFPGGTEEFMKYINKNLKYPELAQENGIEGLVVVRFIVTRVGDITDIELLRGIDPECDKEALRIVKHMPKWIPCRPSQHGYSYYYTLPIRFKLAPNE